MSPHDTLAGLRERAEDYFSIGVPFCWIIDPNSGKAWTATPSGLIECTDGILRAGALEMPLSEVLEA